MPSFGAKSLEKLNTCHPDIIKVMETAIKHMDFTVLYGTRTVAEQQALYAQGRTKPGPIVTSKDGVKKKSKHNYTPSLAVDIAPWKSGKGIDWDDIDRFKELAVVVKKAADTVGVAIQWGGDWKTFKDWPHWEIKG